MGLCLVLVLELEVLRLLEDWCNAEFFGVLSIGVLVFVEGFLG